MRPTASTRPEDRAVHVRIWGSRGSVPTPGPGTVRFGGNTPCVEVLAAGSRIILDGGTGLRSLGTHLARTDETLRAALVLTHFHWDHIQGLPFFRPLWEPTTEVEVVGPAGSDARIREMVARLLDPLHFPVPFRTLASGVDFRALTELPLERGDATVRTFRVRHPSATVAVRVEIHGRAVCYVPDNELVGGEYPVAAGWRDGLVDFVGGADLLLHDAMYTAGEMETREGWGHSTPEQAVELARDAAVPRLHLFHHAPWRTDDDLERLAERVQDRAVELGYRGTVDAAREGSELVLEGGDADGGRPPT